MTGTIVQRTTGTLIAAPQIAVIVTLDTLTVALQTEGTIALHLVISNAITAASTATSASSAPTSSNAMTGAHHVAIVHHPRTATTGDRTVTHLLLPETDAPNSHDSIRLVPQPKLSNSSSTCISLMYLCVAYWTADRRRQACSPDSLSTTAAAVTSSRVLAKSLWPSTELQVQSGALLTQTQPSPQQSTRSLSKSSKVSSTMRSADSTSLTNTPSQSNPLQVESCFAAEKPLILPNSNKREQTANSLLLYCHRCATDIPCLHSLFSSRCDLKPERYSFSASTTLTSSPCRQAYSSHTRQPHKTNQPLLKSSTRQTALYQFRKALPSVHSKNVNESRTV